MLYTLIVNFVDDEDSSHTKIITEVAEKYRGELVDRGTMLMDPPVVDMVFEFPDEPRLRKAADAISSMRYSCRATLTEDDGEKFQYIETGWMTYAKLNDVLFSQEEFVERMIAFEALMVDVLNDIKPEHQHMIASEMTKRVLELLQEVNLDNAEPQGHA
jgi:hypothetical protein